MYEVELKVRASHDRVRERLDDLDADHVETVTQVDTYYDAPDRDFVETDEALRIREETKAGETAVLVTYKGPLVEAASKTREEAETAVGDGEEMRSILSGLGYEAAATVRKERERYALGGCTVTLDDVDGLEEFVEVERESEGGVTTEEDIDSAREQAIDVMEELGLDADEQIQTSYLGMVLARE